MDFSMAIYPPPDMQYLIRAAILEDDDAAAIFLDNLPVRFRLGAIFIAYTYYLGIGKGHAERGK